MRDMLRVISKKDFDIAPEELRSLKPEQVARRAGKAAYPVEEYFYFSENYARHRDVMMVLEGVLRGDYAIALLMGGMGVEAATIIRYDQKLADDVHLPKDATRIAYYDGIDTKNRIWMHEDATFQTLLMQAFKYGEPPFENIDILAHTAYMEVRNYELIANMVAMSHGHDMPIAIRLDLRERPETMFSPYEPTKESVGRDIDMSKKSKKPAKQKKTPPAKKEAIFVAMARDEKTRLVPEGKEDTLPDPENLKDMIDYAMPGDYQYSFHMISQSSFGEDGILSPSTQKRVDEYNALAKDRKYETIPLDALREGKARLLLVVDTHAAIHTAALLHINRKEKYVEGALTPLLTRESGLARNYLLPGQKKMMTDAMERFGERQQGFEDIDVLTGQWNWNQLKHLHENPQHGVTSLMGKTLADNVIVRGNRGSDYTTAMAHEGALEHLAHYKTPKTLNARQVLELFTPRQNVGMVYEADVVQPPKKRGRN